MTFGDSWDASDLRAHFVRHVSHKFFFSDPEFVMGLSISIEQSDVSVLRLNFNHVTSKVVFRLAGLKFG